MSRRVCTTAAAVLLLGLGACTGGEDPEPILAPPVESSSSPPTTAEPTSEPTPEPESAAEFIRRWAQVEMEMENSGETAEYRALSPGCEACRKLADQVDSIYAADGFIEWGGWDIRSIKRHEDFVDGYEVVVVSSPTRYRETKGGPLKRFAGGRDSHLLIVRENADGWYVRAKDRLAR